MIWPFSKRRLERATLRRPIDSQPQKRDGDGKKLVGRRFWESTDTNRLNAEHWKYAGIQETPISNDQDQALTRLRVRSKYEIANNAMLAGVVETWVSDMLQKLGPQLRVTSKTNPEYAKRLSEIWQRWWLSPDIRGRQTGVEMLRTAFRGYWSDGEYLIQIVDDKQSRTRIMGKQFTTKLTGISPRRLKSPYAATNDNGNNIAMGIEVDSLGRAVRYHIEDEKAFGAYVYNTGMFSEVTAANMVHDYMMTEPDQVRGVPWLACNLGTISELRDFDQQVLDAARKCASQSYVIYSDHAGLQPMELEQGEEVEVKRNTMTVLPPGWKATFTPASQPANNYKDFRHDRMRELGRYQGMPLLHIMLDAREHNFATARLDRQMYRSQLIAHQDRIEYTTLDRLVSVVEREAQLLGLLGEAPDDLYTEWIWPSLHEGDQKLAAQAVTEQLKNGTISEIEAINARGRDPIDVINEKKEWREMLQAAGMNESAEGIDSILKKVDNFIVPIEQIIEQFAPDASEEEKRRLAELWRAKNEPEQSSIFQYHIQTGVVTINEVRERLELPPVPWGDVPASSQPPSEDKDNV